MRRSAASLMVLLAVAGAACGKTKTIETRPGASPSFTTKVAGTITVGSDIPYPPFEFNDKAGKLVGFDVELFDAVAAKIGAKTKWVDSAFDTIFTSLASGAFDAVVSSVTAYAPPGSPAASDVAKRTKIVAFTKPYYSSLQSLTVDAKKHAEITSTDDLKSGDRVAVQSGTTGATWAKVNLEPKGVVLVRFTKAAPMFQALEGGQVKGVVNDLPVSLDAIKTKADLKVVQQIETGEQYAFAVQKENPGLLAALNGALDAVFEDGTYERLFKKYFPDQEMPAYAKA